MRSPSSPTTIRSCSASAAEPGSERVRPAGHETGGMSEPLFFKASALTVGEIATLTGAEPHPQADLGRRITNVAPLDRAAACDLAFLDSLKYVGELAATRAGACLV